MTENRFDRIKREAKNIDYKDIKLAVGKTTRLINRELDDNYNANLKSLLLESNELLEKSLDDYQNGEYSRSQFKFNSALTKLENSTEEKWNNSYRKNKMKSKIIPELKNVKSLIDYNHIKNKMQ